MAFDILFSMALIYISYNKRQIEIKTSHISSHFQEFFIYNYRRIIISHIRKMLITSAESQNRTHCEKINETKALIINWLSMSREDKRKFDWEQKSQNMYHFLFPIIFDDFNLNQSLISQISMIEKFNKFISLVFRVKNLNDSEQIFNLNQVFLLNLGPQVIISEFCKNTVKNRSVNKLNLTSSNNMQNSGIVLVGEWQKIDFYTNLIKVKAADGRGSIGYADRAIVNKFKFQIVKEDFEIKSNFLKTYLFSSKSFNFSINSITVKRMKRGEVLKPGQDKLYLIFEGSVIQQITVDKTNAKRKFELVRGGIVSKRSFKQFLKNNYVCQLPYKMQNLGSTSYYLLTDSLLLEIGFSQLAKIVKNEKGAKKKMTQRLQQIENAQIEIASRSINAENLLKSADRNITQLHYSMPRSKTSKAFRRKTQPKQSLEFHESEYEQFITFDRYEKMTQNKVNVQKKHLIFCELNNLLREKQKEERFIKKMNTIKGMKEIKKCEYQARLKKSKIENLAIKDSIMNAEKFRDKPHQIKFIFEQEIIEKLVKTQIDSNVLTNKKFVSMLELSENNQKETTHHHPFQSIANSKQLIAASKSPTLPKAISRFYKHKSVKILESDSKKSIMQNSERNSKAKFGTSENIKQKQFQCV